MRRAVAVIAMAGAGLWLLAAAQRPARPPQRVRQPGTFRNTPVQESSGVTVSRRFPGKLWTINDSGNDPVLYLTDTLGAVHGSVKTPFPNQDWEAVGGGPCGDRWCIYIGDTGDNRAVRKHVTIYRIPEPTDAELAAGKVASAESIAVSYPDGPRDVEAIAVARSGGIGLIGKGQLQSNVYWVSPTAWQSRTAVATFLWRLPVATSLLLARLVTDAALSPDESLLAIRSYREIYLFTRDGAGPLPSRLVASCSIRGLEPQGEGIGWYDATTLVMTSESTRLAPGPITLLQCPVGSP